jgi:hypothetical protein
MLKDRKLSLCPICNKLMAGSTPRGVCFDCFDEDERMFQLVKSCIQIGEKLGPVELSDKSGILLKHIKRWLDLGKLG